MRFSKAHIVRSESDPRFLSAARELLYYSEETGQFTWRRNWYCAKAGAVAGNANHQGYWVVGLFGADRYAHRLAWLFHTGALPIFTIDHINGEKADNRIANLRDVPIAVNVQNAKRCRSGNRSGLLGVTYRPDLDKWQAGLAVGGEHHYLGVHATKEAAHAAYVEAKRRLHPGSTL